MNGDEDQQVEEPVEEQHEHEQPAVSAAPLADLDDLKAVGGPEFAIAESLRNALGEMRGEADRIAGLGTGDEQVAAAEQFAEDAGRLDEAIGSSARADEHEHG